MSQLPNCPVCGGLAQLNLHNTLVVGHQCPRVEGSQVWWDERGRFSLAPGQLGQQRLEDYAVVDRLGPVDLDWLDRFEVAVDNVATN